MESFSNAHHPIFEVKSINLIKYLFLAIAFGLIGVAALYRKQLDIAIILPLFLALVILLSIRFTRICVYSFGIVKEKKSLIPFLSSQNQIDLNTIRSVRFKEGQKSAQIILIQLFYRFQGQGERSKPDQIIIDQKNGQKRVINRFGTRKEFQELFSVVKQGVSAFNNQNQ